MMISDPAGGIFYVTQMGTLTVAILPAEFLYASQAGVVAVAEASNIIHVSQAGVMIVARGRVSDPKVRAWTFTLDGHDFYVLRLGNQETLICDLTTEQWHVWGSDSGALWRAYTGGNWLGGMGLGATYGSNVLVGDDGNGALYFLDPNGLYDDDALLGDEIPRAFERIITGQVATKSIDALPCFGVQLIGSVGETTESSLTTVTLYTSDDQGNTYDEHDTITIDSGDHTARVEWTSLGSFDAPGRLFQIQDFGALYRIDFLEMMDPPDA